MKSLAKLKKEIGIWMCDMPIPKIGHNDVLIKIKKTSICGTDIHIYNWDDWAKKTIPVPMIVGHEYSGEIAAIGSEVTGLKIGDRVSGEGHIPCGFCRNCRTERRHLCYKVAAVGITRPGCFAEYLSIPATSVYPLSDKITDEQAAILDPLGNATNTALSFDIIGEDILITGAGPIGIMSAAIAKHVGARNVVVTDINDYRLEMAKKMGATYAVDIKNESLTDVMKNLGIKEGFDIGLEMSGNAAAFNVMLSTINHGGKIALLGFLPQNTSIDWNQIIMKGVIIKGIYGREIFGTWYKMTSMLENGLNIDPIITHRFYVDDFQKGFDIMNSGKSGKVILDWTK